MTLYLIGIGLNDEKDITLKGLEAVKKCKHVYLEMYTSILSCPVQSLGKLYHKKVIPVDRNMIEEEGGATIIKEAIKENVALLIIGDVFAATTHMPMMEMAHQQGINVEIINNASIFSAIGITGLHLYKFGKTTSIPFENKNVTAPYDVLKANQIIEAHTLILLDLKPSENKFMTIKDAITYLLTVESKKKQKVFTEKTKCLGCAQIGSDQTIIKYGAAKEIMGEKFDSFPQCLVVPSKLHFTEEDFLKLYEKS